MDLQTIDYKLMLMKGTPIGIGGVGQLKPFTVGEVVEFGYMKYQTLLRSLTAKVEDIVQGKLELPENIELSTFDLAMNIPDENNEFRVSFLDAVRLFLREEELVPMKLENGVDIIIIGDISEQRILHRENFKDMRSILLAQNGMRDTFETKERKKPQKPINQKAQEILDSLKKANEQVEEIKRKQNGGNEIDLADIISSVTAKSPSISKFNVWDLNLYQLYDEFKRLEAINQYDVNIEAMMQGAKDVKLRHWSSRLLD